MQKMVGRKKPRKNLRNSTKTKRESKFLGRILLGFKLIVAVVAVAAMSAFFILVHDILTQCDYFKISRLTIEGTQRLSKKEIAKQARVGKGMNILAVNLSLVRKQLLAHPWIAEAGVSREIPSGLSIRVKEHTPLAVVDVGKKFLINHGGKIFKAWDASDPTDLPVVSGLNVLDLPPVYGQTELPESDIARERTTPFKAVMNVLRLGRQQGSILPNRSIRQIRVDRQIGLTLLAFDRIKTINLGYDDYDGKYHMLANLFSYLKRQQSGSDFDRIDLNNLNRVVVNPLRRE
ncbi:MAG: FtsQ-type POTRA domain-containing protein [Desulfobacterales bacterium]